MSGPSPAQEDDPARQDHKVPWKVAWLLSAACTVGTIVVIQPPAGFWPWAIFLASVAGLTFLASHGSSAFWKWIMGIPPTTIALMVKTAVVTLTVVAMLVGIALAAGRPMINFVNKMFLGCPHPAEVRVMTTPELLTIYRGLADEFERVAAEKNLDCRPAELHVYAPSPRKAREGLAAGWSPEYLSDHGPRPDIWLPDAKVHVDELRHRREVSGFGPDMQVIDSIATTPIVLGMPASAGIKQDDPEWQGRRWATLVRNLRAKGLGLIRPAPEVSTVGDFGTVAIYTSENSGVGLAENPAPARDFEHWVDATSAAGRFPVGGTGPELMRRQRELGKDARPMVMSEQELVEFNEAVRGRNGRGCDAENGPEGCLLAFYPIDTHRLDLPFAQLTWPDSAQSEEQKKAAAEFGAWLTSTEGRSALISGRLRPPAMTVRLPLTKANGVVPGAPQTYVTMANPPPAVRDSMLAIRDKAKQTGKVLISVDASGSMRERVGRDTRFALTTAAVHAAYDQLAQRAEVSLNVFSATLGIVPVTRDSLAAVSPAGNTPQYRAILKGMQTVGRDGVLVVVTDGADNVNDVAPQQLLEQAGVRVLVLAFGEASCATQALTDVTTKTGGGCRQAGISSLTADLAELLRGV
ncbi:Mg-chelatase subunit ChlD [Kibdelosporangium banguiense]|uniref:Mg-chelatase subunit ChlD n=1 Tax=Kibdelosporangium banguiense TaxID=1365924 RepID=A0ABS4TPN5_9PSEU|nr:vWA domain-containing protein [Kibdelosporangium banguiense]MBP2326361.1 Mg-chelatase subunit ChlD [Kibdelosporangium banguiense]